jgi:DNA-binding MarR family transcriptional regulator
MDYEGLAKELLQSMLSIRRTGQPMFAQDGAQGEAFVLYHIKRNGEAIPSDISGAMGISSARVAVVLNSLENKGLITREIDSGDRRRIIVRLTPKGIDQAEDRRRKNVEMIKDVLTKLGERDAKEYVRITERLAEILSEIRGGRADGE